MRRASSAPVNAGTATADLLRPCTRYPAPARIGDHQAARAAPKPRRQAPATRPFNNKNNNKTKEHDHESFHLP